jgi:hypothetical protein
LAAQGELPRVAGEGVQGVAGLGAGCPPEGDGPALARGSGDGCGAALGAGLLDVASAVQDRAGLGHDLGEIDLTDARHGGQQPGLGVPEQPGAKRSVEFGDGAQPRSQQADLGADQVGEDLRGESDGGCGGAAQPCEELGGAAAAAVGVPPAEGALARSPSA